LWQQPLLLGYVLVKLYCAMVVDGSYELRRCIGHAVVAAVVAAVVDAVIWVWR
jgi:hypothetical protein